MDQKSDFFETCRLKGSPGGPKVLQGAILATFWAHLGGIWRSLGAILLAFWIQKWRQETTNRSNWPLSSQQQKITANSGKPQQTTANRSKWQQKGNKCDQKAANSRKDSQQQQTGANSNMWQRTAANSSNPQQASAGPAKTVVLTSKSIVSMRFHVLKQNFDYNTVLKRSVLVSSF